MTAAMNKARLNPVKATLFIGMLTSTVCTAESAREDVKVTPYRPTVTNSATLSVPGWVELETGVIRQKASDGSHQSGIPYLAKMAITQDFGVLLGGDAFLAQVAADKARISGGGDTLLLLKHRFALDSDSAFGCEYGFKAPTAAQGLGSGKSDYVLNGIFSKDIRGHALDINMNVTRLGDALVNESAYLYGWSGTVFRPVDEKWGVMAELSGTTRSGTLPQSQWLLAASYEWSSRLVLDAGVSSGIDSRSHRFALFAGMSMLLGKVH